VLSGFVFASLSTFKSTRPQAAERDLNRVKRLGAHRLVACESGQDAPMIGLACADLDGPITRFDHLM
jgi:hypothetical protein